MSLKRHALWSMLPLLSVTVVNLVSVPLFYRFLGAEMYALWFYVATLSGAFGFLDLGLGVAVGRYIGVALGRDDSAAVREYWGTANAIAMPLLGLMAFVFAAVGVIFGPQWFNVESERINLLRNCFLFGGGGIFISYYSQFWLILSQAHLDFKFVAVLRTITALLGVISSVALAWWTASPLVLIAWACVLGGLQLLVLIWNARKSYGLGLEFADARWLRVKEMASYTGKTFLSLILNSVVTSVDRLLLGRLAPAAAFSHYTIALNAGSRIQGLSAAVMGPIFSNTSRSIESGGTGSVAAIYNETFDFTFPFYLFVAGWTAIWHETILRLWLGQELATSVSPIFTPVVLACCITAIANISAAQLGSLNRVGTNLIFNAVAGVLMVAFVYVGWHMGQLAGVAWGFLASRIALVAQDIYLVRSIGAGGYLAASTWRELLIHGGLAAGFFPLLHLIPRESNLNLVPATVHLIILAAWVARSPLRRYVGPARPDLRPGNLGLL